MIQTAINRVFPEEFGQDGPTAHGMSDEQIEIRVPPSWKDDVFNIYETHVTHHNAIAKSRISCDFGQTITPCKTRAQKTQTPQHGAGVRLVIAHLQSSANCTITPMNFQGLQRYVRAVGLGDPVCVPFLVEMATSNVGLGSRLDAIDLLKKNDWRLSN